jgi:hypothetical protein
VCVCGCVWPVVAVCGVCVCVCVCVWLGKRLTYSGIAWR